MTQLREKCFIPGKNLKNYKGFIFDLDGTLLDSKQDLTDATNATILALGGKALPVSLIESFVGRGVRDLIAKTLADVKGVSADEALDFFTQSYLQNSTKHSRFFNGADDFLKWLKLQNKKCGVLTNKPQLYTDNILHKLGKTDLFDFVLGAENGFACKPDPTGFFAILKSWNLQPSDILYFGDSEVDAETAQNAGCDFALYLEGFISEKHLAPYYDFATVAFRDYQKLHNHFEAAFR